jgi:hypothetical protein
MPKPVKLRVKNSGLISLRCFSDAPDGDLFIAEAGRQIPFPIKRVYFINNLANARAVRGRHAHRRLEQVLFCINGALTLALDDGTKRQSIRLTDAATGIRLGPRLWHTMTKFSKDCVILVFASAHFDERDYIRDYDEFLKLAR